MTNPNKNSTVTLHVICAFFFLLFSFCYLYDYQADILGAIQHVLSRGQTHYDRTIGAAIITIVAWLLQILVYAVSKLRGVFHALTYLPSLLLLGILTCADGSIVYGNYMGNWLWGYPLLMAVYAGVVWMCFQYESVHHTHITMGFIRQLWVNIAALVVMMIITCAVGSTSKVLHYRLAAERCLMEGRPADALRIGYNEEATDSSLTLLRVWALSQEHALGERLFEYPLVGGTDALLPDSARGVRLVMIPTEKLYRYLGVVYKQKMPALTYLEKIHEKKWAKPAAHDWLLTAYLLNGDLDKFAKTLTRYYDVSRELPKHYREALVLYNHLKAHPVVVYHDEVKDADYEDFQALRRKERDPNLRYAALKKSYGKSYWFYYYGMKKL